jgi:uncharacterized repeat protein (TIGR03803 family)
MARRWCAPVLATVRAASRIAIASLAAAALAGTIGRAAAADDQTVPNAAKESSQDQLSEVVVTGSRIKRTDEERLEPTTSLDMYTAYLQWTPPQTPVSGFALGSDGSLYGTTYGSEGSGGTAYRISPSQGYVQMHAFPGPVWPSGSTDGLQPQGGLTVGSDGNVYGMTLGGGASGDGTIFKIDTVAIDPKYPETQLYSWSGGQAAAVGPDGAMTLGTDGNLYGVRGPVAGSNEGAIFEITPSGTFTNWYTFSGPDGSYPMAGLVQGANGSFYGTTFEGGANGDGTVFELSFGEQCLGKL